MLLAGAVVSTAFWACGVTVPGELITLRGCVSAGAGTVVDQKARMRLSFGK